MKTKYTIIILAFFNTVGIALFADGPQWWKGRGVLNSGTAHDFYPVNQGQLKWVCVKAYDELQAKLPSAGNTNILNVINVFPSGNNFRPVNLGMLKRIAQPFYVRLIEEGYATNFPWAGKTAHDYALANQGQLKMLFSFDLDGVDSDADGMPDWFENLYGPLNPGDDPDEDGLTNLQEYQQGSNPLVAD